jgi:hypothetical protein
MTISHRITALLLIFSLTSCSYFSGDKPAVKVAPVPVKHAHAAKTVKPSSPRIPADNYVSNLSQARLALLAQQPDNAQAGLEAMQAYMAQKTLTPENQTIVILTYKNNATAATQYIIAPLTLPSGTAEFPALLDLMAKLRSMPYTLHDLRLATATVTPVDMPDPALTNAAQMQPWLERQQQDMLDRSQALPRATDVAEQLQLIRFFTTHHCKDAAYLSADNAKKTLASATRDGSLDADTLGTLSQELDNLETRLHHDMPYTL